MKLSESEVRQIAWLARLRVDAEHLDTYARELGRILTLFEALAAADTDGVEPMAHPMELTQRLRPDEVTESDQRAAFQAVAPRVSDGLYVVPKVIE